jgi:hypothetical protein
LIIRQRVADLELDVDVVVKPEHPRRGGHERDRDAGCRTRLVWTGDADRRPQLGRLRDACQLGAGRGRRQRDRGACVDDMREWRGRARIFRARRASQREQEPPPQTTRLR